MPHPDTVPFTVEVLRALIDTPQGSPHAQSMWDHECNVKVLALTLDGEGRNQSIEGRAAIAWTVKNRVKQRIATDPTIRAACLRRLQYSCWSRAGGAANFERTLHRAALAFDGGVGDPLYRESEYIAAGVISGLLLDPTQGSTHYLTRTMYQHDCPSWAAQGHVAVTIGDHIFLNRVP